MSRRERKLLRRLGKKYKPDETISEPVNGEAKAAEHNAERKHGSKVRAWLENYYENHNRKAMVVTFILLILSLGIIGYHQVAYGEFIPRGVSLKGGTTITVPTEQQIDIDELQTKLRDAYPQASISVRELSSAGSAIGFTVDASDVSPQDLEKTITKETGVDKFSVETIGSSLGGAFFKQVIIAMIIAFALMALVVFISFRDIVPSGAVVLAAFSDIVMTIAVIDVLGIKIETAGIAALLMLIGYSVDTDILLTTRVVKRQEGSVVDRVINAMGTGLTMTFTAMAAVFVAMITTHSETLRQIMVILFIGLIFDLINTWIQNAGILMNHMKHKSHKHATETLQEFEEVVPLEEEK